MPDLEALRRELAAAAARHRVLESWFRVLGLAVLVVGAVAVWLLAY
jgi:uncharacterized protein YjeT (DUF2065 family)